MLLPDQLETLRRLRAEGESDETAPNLLGMNDVLEGKELPAKAQKAIRHWFEANK